MYRASQHLAAPGHEALPMRARRSMALINSVRRWQDRRRAAGTWPTETPTRPAEAVPAPRRGVDPRHLRAVPPGSLAASVVAAGLEDVALGLERLPPRRGRAWPLWPLGLALGIALIVAAGVLWLYTRPLVADRPAASPHVAAPETPRGAAPAV